MLQLPGPALCPFFVTSRFNLLKTLLVLVPLLPLCCSSSPGQAGTSLLHFRYYKHDLCFGRWWLFYLLITYWKWRPDVISLSCCPVLTFTQCPTSIYCKASTPYLLNIRRLEFWKKKKKKDRKKERKKKKGREGKEKGKEKERKRKKKRKKEPWCLLRRGENQTSCLHWLIQPNFLYRTPLTREKWLDSICQKKKVWKALTTKNVILQVISSAYLVCAPGNAIILIFFS